MTDVCTSFPPLSPDKVEVDGPLQNMTVESGTTVRLTCTQESKETTDITYTWSREGGIPLPDGAQANNGV